MNRFRFKNIRLRKIISIIILSILLYLYFTILINGKINDYIIDKIDSKYKIKDANIKNSIIYNSLNKVVSIDTLKEKRIVNNVIKQNIITKKEEKKEPIIYIYNTHETEKYNLPFISDYSITPDVRLASYILKDYLNDFEIESFIQTKSTKEYINKNKLPYSGTYEASRVYMQEEFKKHNYKIVIDLHRDSSKHKYTFLESKNKRYAKVLFVLSTKHKKYKENEKFVNNLNNRIKKELSGLSRGIMKRDDVIFNQDLNNRAILLELGGIDNTLEEINNTLYIIAKVISDYIKEEI